jgi:hypothetical protein
LLFKAWKQGSELPHVCQWWKKHIRVVKKVVVRHLTRVCHRAREKKEREKRKIKEEEGREKKKKNISSWLSSPGSLISPECCDARQA